MCRDKLTTEEHEARAMLLGLVYRKDVNYYYRRSDHPDYNDDDRFRLDADTLELLSVDEAWERQKAAYERGDRR